MAIADFFSRILKFQWQYFSQQTHQELFKSEAPDQRIFFLNGTCLWSPISLFSILFNCFVKHISSIWKTFFLVTWVLAMSSSEVHTLTFAELGFEDNCIFTVSANLPEFHLKTNRQLAFMKILALDSLVKRLNEGRLFCLVCALKIYRARTISTTKKNPQMRRLFISYMKGFSNDICENTSTGWIRFLIKFAWGIAHTTLFSFLLLNHMKLEQCPLPWPMLDSKTAFQEHAGQITWLSLHFTLFEGYFHYQWWDPFFRSFDGCWEDYFPVGVFSDFSFPMHVVYTVGTR